jgi:hypothetical protein
MAEITVLKPNEDPPAAASIAYATRGAIPDGAHMVLIDNGKPHARDLMQFVAKELQERYPITTVEVFSKPSAGKPIEADEAKKMAARAYLVISGVGD